MSAWSLGATQWGSNGLTLILLKFVSFWPAGCLEQRYFLLTDLITQQCSVLAIFVYTSAQQGEKSICDHLYLRRSFPKGTKKSWFTHNRKMKLKFIIRVWQSCISLEFRLEVRLVHFLTLTTTDILSHFNHHLKQRREPIFIQDFPSAVQLSQDAAALSCGHRVSLACFIKASSISLRARK